MRSLLAILVSSCLVTVVSAAPAPEKGSSPPKDSWRYEVEIVLEPADDLAVYRLRVWTADKRGVYFDVGGLTLEGSTRPAPGGKLFRADVVIVVELNEQRSRLHRRIRFDRDAGAATDMTDDVPADSRLPALVKVKEASGKKALGKKITVGELHGQELRVQVE